MSTLGIINLPVFMFAVLLLNVTPGPDTAYIVGRSVSQGRAAGLMSSLGVSAGCCVHVLAVAFGLTALLAASAVAFTVIKAIGAAYLIYLGIRKLLIREEEAENGDVKPESLSRIYWQGFMINLLNPKTALFYFAFLPQFVDPAKGNVTAQTLFLGAIFVGMAFITDSLYALLASSLAERLRGNRHYQKGQRYFAGLVYVGLGITTALTGSKK